MTISEKFFFACILRLKLTENLQIERQFTRRLTLPKDTKPELVTSELTKDGKLTVQTPKKEKNLAQTRTIPILRKD